MLTSRTAHNSQGTRKGRCSEEVIPGPAKKQEGKEKKSGKVNSGGEIRLRRLLFVRFIRPGLQCSLKRTNGRCEDLASRELSFHCRISLHFAPSWLGGFIRLGRGASAPQIEGMSMGEDAGSPEETPAIISLGVSRYQKNIQIWEKTYPECRGGGGRGLDGSTEDQNKFPTAGKGETGQAAAHGRPSSIAPDSGGQCGVPFKVSLRGFFHSDFDINKSCPPTGSKKVPASIGEPTASSEQSREGRAGRASGRGGGEGRVAAARRAWASDTRGGAGLALRGRSARGLALGYSSPSLLPEGNSTMKARSPPVDGLA